MEQQDDTQNPYRIALWKAVDELGDLQRQEQELTVRKARIKQTIDALWSLAYPGEPEDVSSMTLANAIRLIINSTGRAVTVKEIRSRLNDIGFDLSKYGNPLASIHTAASRMIATEELVYVEDEDEKKLAAGPELKPVPPPETPQTLDALRDRLRNRANALGATFGLISPPDEGEKK